MIDFSHSSFVTPEGIVVLSIFCIGVSCSREDLVPVASVNIGLWNTVWWLTAK